MLRDHPLMTSPKFEVFLTPSHFCDAKMTVLMRISYLGSQKWLLPSFYLRDVIYIWSLINFLLSSSFIILSSYFFLLSFFYSFFLSFVLSLVSSILYSFSFFFSYFPFSLFFLSFFLSYFTFFVIFIFIFSFVRIECLNANTNAATCPFRSIVVRHPLERILSAYRYSLADTSLLPDLTKKALDHWLPFRWLFKFENQK